VYFDVLSVDVIGDNDVQQCLTIGLRGIGRLLTTADECG
jgi:hypothetical protein